MKPRSSRTHSAHDVIDSSPESPDSPESSSPGPTAYRGSPDPIELESPFASQSSPGERREGPPSPKRRRITISPELLEPSSPPYPDDNPLTARESDTDPLSDPSDDDPGPPSPDSATYYPDHLNPGAHPSPRDPAPRAQAAAAAAAHPTFHRAPRFRAAEASPASRPQYPLPDAFSPQRGRRRGGGAKYVSGGLAAELRDWLVEVKGGGGGGGDADLADAPVSAAVLPVIEVEEARPGPGMWLVRGWQRVPDGEGGTRCVGVRAMLAGEGRLSGLGRRNEVAGGCVVRVSHPAWEVELRDGRWSVACDWHVVEEDGG